MYLPVTVRTIYSIFVGVMLCGLLNSIALAETFHLKDNQTLVGEPISPDVKGVVIRLEDGTTSDRTAWEKFTQDSLKAFKTYFESKKNTKAASVVEEFIEPSEEELAAAAKRSELVIKTDYPKLDRPAPQGLIKSLFGSGIGLLAILLIYGANIYAGYEVSIFRIRPPALVCGVSAVVPILGPIIFLCMPTQVESKEDIIQEPMREKESYHVGDMTPEAELPAELDLNAPPQLPPTQTFARGQFTFNRRFFETKFAGFFGVVKRDADKDMLLIINSARGSHTADRIIRIGLNEIHIQVSHGGASEEVMIPFLEIQEVVLKHRHA